MTSEEITIKSLMQLFMWTDEKEFLKQIDISKNAYYQDLKSACKISIKLSRQELLKEIIGEVENQKNVCTDHIVYSNCTPGLRAALKILTSKLNEDGK